MTSCPRSGRTRHGFLGNTLAVRRIIFERACTGPRVRQKDTAKLVGEVYRNEGVPFPALSGSSRSSMSITEKRFWKRACPNCSKLTQEFVISTRRTMPRVIPAGRHATFQKKLFEAVITKWACGLICPQGVEPWSEFCSRVDSGLMSFLSAGGRGEPIAIFTSGGPIAVARQRALRLFSGKHFASELDVEEFFVERISLFGRPFYTQRFQCPWAYR